MKLIDNALIYTEMGWSVFPIDVMTKRPLTKHGFKDASEDSERVIDWFTRYPDAGIALAIPEGMAIIDIDHVNKMRFIENLPDTVMSKTPRIEGGAHLFFQLPEGIKLKRKINLEEHVDLLTHGGYAILPYSKHHSGGRYKWINSPLKKQMGALPQWVIDKAWQKDKIEIELRETSIVDEILNGVKEGDRNNALYKYACSMRSRRFSLQEALERIVSAASKCDPPYTERDPRQFVERVYKTHPEGSSNWRKIRGWKAKDLMEANLKEPTWFIERILPEGVCVLAGDPKVGKSIQTENMAYAIAKGEKVWGELLTRQSDVLYLDIELSDVLGKKRWAAIFRGRDIPDNLTIYFDWERMDQGGYDRLDTFLTENTKTKVVFIDVLGKFWPTKPFVDGTAYNQDRAVIDKIGGLAKKHNACIVCVHHRPKMRYGDLSRDMSGSMGIGAAADTLWGLSKDNERRMLIMELDGKMIENHTPIELIPVNGNMLRWSMAPKDSE